MARQNGRTPLWEVKMGVPSLVKTGVLNLCQVQTGVPALWHIKTNVPPCGKSKLAYPLKSKQALVKTWVYFSAS